MGAIVIGLDLGRRTGVAIGEPGALPESFVLTLGKPGDPQEKQFGNLLNELQKIFAEHRPALICVERVLPLGAFAAKATAAKSVEHAHAMRGVVMAITDLWCAAFETVAPQTWRKHFTGKGNWGGRREAKRATILRARALGYVPDDCYDDDRCDALGVWDYACATFAGIRPRELTLFPPAAQTRRRKRAT